MANDKKKLSRLEWEIEINIRARKDPEFRKQLLKDPQKALEKLGCQSGLDPKRVKIVEETGDSQIVVLRKEPVVDKSVLSEELKKNKRRQRRFLLRNGRVVLKDALKH